MFLVICDCEWHETMTSLFARAERHTQPTSRNQLILEDFITIIQEATFTSIQSISIFVQVITTPTQEISFTAKTQLTSRHGNDRSRSIRRIILTTFHIYRLTRTIALVQTSWRRQNRRKITGNLVLRPEHHL